MFFYCFSTVSVQMCDVRDLVFFCKSKSVFFLSPSEGKVTDIFIGTRGRNGLNLWVK